MTQIDSRDISYAEQMLLHNDESFDDERRAVIQCLESKDIIACPGSGKTTALLAKLAILAGKLPFENNKGICVLTHTNVAINEIKSRLGIQGEKLFSYPHNCSTIQSFVNQFLAIPAYIHFYGKRPIRIDDEVYNEEIIKKYYQNIPRNLQFGIAKRNIDVQAIRFNLENENIQTSLYGRKVYENEQSSSYLALKGLKRQMLQDGILCHDDAYFLAYKYLRENPNLKGVFSNRFLYVFIDEMQDTMMHQKELLELLFDDSVVIQRIGDLNQSIYDQSGAIGSWEVVPESSLEISDSKRFSKAIADIVKNICVTPQNLNGNTNIEDIRPYLLVYNSTNIQNVLEEFAKIIIERDLHNLDRKVFKAIGWVSEHEREIGIKNYWEEFKTSRRKRSDFNSLRMYLLEESSEDLERFGANLYNDKVLKGILKTLRIMNEKNEGKHYTKQRFLNYLKESHNEIYEDLMLKLSRWCLMIQNHQEVVSEVEEFITEKLKRIFNWDDISQLTSFFSNTEEELTEVYSVQTNVMKFLGEGNEVDIEVASIHSVKGETHTATLYLETFYFEYDIKRIIAYLKGNHTNTNRSRMIQNLKMAYVGMTRPTHLLCVAVREESINGHEAELNAAGWDIKYVGERVPVTQA
ncbi:MULTISPECIES: UvrD-helicase domain-containing protein [Bacillus cereus group]|uniref:UvrD-helicase domain-containing protein n=1 Tax=Bacillus cereus group TaxID=86661 RepID=UPI001E2A622C|nr:MULTISPECIES: UvrD-helicase domain-containing protein [Bacillus cereus group]MCC2500890.1 UvrD-helicase domain-containing protein [Bacillus paranthracis]MDA2595909.1 UvrD-helicase domain-containing protein [Bacillus cereus group sp. Bc061]MDF9580666.1 UvrD-helicase domain-containing protein [Bacillus paranthracis]MDG1617294.1 UvrD-helicase domain-containing protein [Bacillus paranthracis]